MLDGFGHLDRIHVPDSSDGAPFEGLTICLFDPATDTWRIWWSLTWRQSFSWHAGASWKTNWIM